MKDLVLKWDYKEHIEHKCSNWYSIDNNRIATLGFKFVQICMFNTELNNFIFNENIRLKYIKVSVPLKFYNLIYELAFYKVHKKELVSFNAIDGFIMKSNNIGIYTYKIEFVDSDVDYIQIFNSKIHILNYKQ